MVEPESGINLSRLPENLRPARSECSPSNIGQDKGHVIPIDRSKLPEALGPARNECSPSVFSSEG